MSTAGVFILLVIAAAEGLQQPRLVYPRLLEERSPDGKMVLHLHDELTLNLEGASVAAPRLRVLTHENGRPSTKFYDGEEINRNLYQDAEKMATVSLKAIGKSVELEGVVGPKHRIHPLPTKERSESGLVPHMIHEIDLKEGSDKVLTLREEGQHSQFSPRSDEDRAPGIPPDVVVVEVFIVTDNPHHRHFNNTKQLIIYLCITLNSANLRFSDMANPKVRLMLTGTEQSRDETFLHGDDKYTHDSKTLNQFKSYATEKKSEFGNPDVAFFFTGRDVVTDDENGKTSTNGLGIAFLGGLCTEGYVGLGEDSPGAYTGMFTFSHEIGHLLGAQHDGSNQIPLVPGYVGSQACSWNAGFLMSYKDIGPNHQQFSQCSLTQMRIVITYRGRKCWVILSAGQEEVDLFPGDVITIEETCRTVFPDKPKVSAEVIHPKPNECKVRCSYQEEDGDYIYTYSRNTTAPDFAPCGLNKVCVRGYCRYDTEGKRRHRQKNPNHAPRPKPPQQDVTPKPTTTTTTTERWRWSGWKWWSRGKN
uniref:Putative tick metalloprotease 1 n=1 Tax=Amblyomma parvum TaxID=251391 RepID=A0A023G043_AMBPA